MIGATVHALAMSGFALAVAGCIHALAAAVLVRRLGIDGEPVDDRFPGVSILKPLHGAEPGLYDNLASFCRQDYPARCRSSSASRMPPTRRSPSSGG